MGAVGFHCASIACVARASGEAATDGIPLHARTLPQAQCRTRTGDPFLTMEVLYQLS